MKHDRYKITPAVFVVLIDDEERVLLHRRYRTGYMDGFYDFPSGHLEAGETLQMGACRELLEETGLIIVPDALSLVHINQNNYTPENPYINFMFLGKKWLGTPSICERQKCDHVDFFALNKLPNITPQVRSTLSALQIAKSISFSCFDVS